MLRLSSPLARSLAPIIAILSLVVLGLLVNSTYWKFVLSLTIANIGVGVGLVMLVGYARCITLGTGAVLAIGSYVGTLCYMSYGIPFPLALVFAVIAGAASGLLIAVPGVRFRGHNLALITLVFQVVVIVMLREWRDITGGAQGLAVTPPTLFGWQIVSDDAHLVLIGVVIALLIFPAAILLQGHFGRNLKALAANEVGASAYGISPNRYLIWAFVLSAMMIALAGAVSAPRHRIIDPESFGLHYSILALASPVVGGMSSIWGGIVGGGIMRLIPEILRPVSDYIDLVFAAMVILVLRYAPGGLTDTIGAILLRKGASLPRGAVQAEEYSITPDMSPRRRETKDAAVALAIENVSKRYAALKAVDGASLAVPAGSLFGIIGPNGAGKTTLFNVISGFIVPDSGSVATYGTALQAGNAEQRIGHGIARTFQNVAIFPKLTCFENVLIGLGPNGPLQAIKRSFGRLIRSGQSKSDAARVESALAAVGLASRAGVAAGSLSLGDQRRLEIARAIVSRPRILLLDEPVSGMSVDEAQALKPLLRHVVQNEQITVVLIEHNIGFLLDLCDTLAVMSAGKVVAQGEPKAVIGSSQVQKLYFGNTSAAEHA